MSKNSKRQFYPQSIGINFQSEDVLHTSEIYSKIFGWESLNVSKFHSELKISQETNICLYIDIINGKCPTSPGTITLNFDYEEIKNSIYSNSLWMEHFKKEYSDLKNQYESWLDPFKNRIWFLYS